MMWWQAFKGCMDSLWLCDPQHALSTPSCTSRFIPDLLLVFTTLWYVPLTFLDIILQLRAQRKVRSNPLMNAAGHKLLVAGGSLCRLAPGNCRLSWSSMSST